MLASTVGPEAMDQYGGELADVQALPLERRESLSSTDRDCRSSLKFGLAQQNEVASCDKSSAGWLGGCG